MRKGIKPLLPRLWRFGLALTGNHDLANDLVQSTIVRALERSKQFQPDTYLDRWLMVMMRRIWINEMRKEAVKKRYRTLSAPTQATFVDGLATTEGNIFLAEVLDRLYALPEAQREAMVLVYGEELSYRDAAKELDIPQGTLMSRLSRGRVSLKQSLQEDVTLQKNSTDQLQVKQK